MNNSKRRRHRERPNTTTKERAYARIPKKLKHTDTMRLGMRRTGRYILLGFEVDYKLDGLKEPVKVLFPFRRMVVSRNKYAR